MANKLYEERDVARIAKSLNTHSGDDRGYKVSEMADGIDTFVGGIKHRLDDIIERQGEILDLEMAPEIPNYGYVSEGLEYSFTGWNYEVIGRGSCNDSVIVIPETYDDGINGERRVVRINGIGYMEGQGAFENDQNIEEIVLPEHRVDIYYQALRGSSLKILRNFSGGDSFWSQGLNLEYVSIIDGTNITNYEFFDVSNGVTLDFSRHTSVPELSDVSYINAHEGLRILVPEVLYDEWVSEDSTNWVALKDYIYPVTVSPEKVMDKIDMVEDCVESLYEKGKQAEHDAFWDAYQQNGERVDYRGLFAKSGWNDETFKPKYNIVPNYAFDMLAESAVKTSEYLKKIDLSKSVYNGGVFRNSSVEELGVIDISATMAGWGFTGIFTSATNLRKIEKLVFPTDKNCSYQYPFQYCNSLTDITIGGTIYNTISFEWCPLTKASIVSIINALECDVDGVEIFETQRPATTLTLSLAAVNKAFETSEGANDGSTNEVFLGILVTPRVSNWTITFV